MAEVSNKLLFNNTLLLVIVKAFSMLSSLMIIPLYFVFFDSEAEQVGIWLSILVGVLIILSLDFGIGSRLKNDIIKLEFENKQGVEDTITHAFVSYTYIGLIVFLVALFTLSLISLSVIDLPSGADSQEIKLMFLFFGFFLLLNIPLKINVPILQSRQKNALAGLILVSPQIIIFLYVFIFKVSLSEFKMLELTCALLIVNTALNFILAFKFLNINYAKFLKVFFSFTDSFRCLKDSFSMGFSFFVVQICIIILFNSNELFYSAIGRPDLVLVYQYYYRPFSLFFVGFSIVSLPFWSAIRALFVSGKKTQAVNYAYILFLLNFAVFVLLLPFAYYFDFLLEVWLGPDFYTPNLELVILFSLFSFFMCLLMLITTILNSFDIIGAQSKVLLACVVFKLLIVALYSDSEGGFDVVIYSTVFSLIVAVSFLSFFAVREWRKNFLLI